MLRRFTCAQCRAYATKAAKKQKKAGSRYAVSRADAVPFSIATRYLRAAEVGNKDSSIQVTIAMKERTRGMVPIRGSVSLPYDVKKGARVCVIAKGLGAQEARQAGADIVGAEDIIQKISQGEIMFDKCLAHPDCLALLNKVARILGPKNLMPAAKRGTVTTELTTAIAEAKSKTDYKEKENNISLAIAKTSFTDGQVKSNMDSLLTGLKATAASVGRKFTMDNVYLSSPRGPGVPVHDLL